MVVGERDLGAAESLAGLETTKKKSVVLVAAVSVVDVVREWKVTDTKEADVKEAETKAADTKEADTDGSDVRTHKKHKRMNSKGIEEERF